MYDFLHVAFLYVVFFRVFAHLQYVSKTFPVRCQIDIRMDVKLLLRRLSDYKTDVSRSLADVLQICLCCLGSSDADTIYFYYCHS